MLMFYLLMLLLLVAHSSAQCVYSNWLPVTSCPATCTSGATYIQVRWLQSFDPVSSCTSITQRSLPCGPCTSAAGVVINSFPPPPSNVATTKISSPPARLTVTLTPSSASNPSGCPASCNDGGVCLINYYRALHGAPPLSYSTTLQTYAVNCAAKGASSCQLQDCATGGSGSNAYELLTSDPNAQPPSICVAINSWYQEVSLYRFTSQPWTDNSRNFQAIGHFSQLVWKSTKTVGCGWQRSTCSGRTCFFLNCNYYPAGNVASDPYFYNNVSPRN